MPITTKIDLLETHILTFYRINLGELQEDGFYSDNDPPTEIPDIEGSLQPIRAGLRVRIVPEGFDTESGFFFYTKHYLVGYDENTNTQADYTIINGRKFEVHNTEDWSAFGLNTDNYKYILVARPLNPEGGGF